MHRKSYWLSIIVVGLVAAAASFAAEIAFEYLSRIAFLVVAVAASAIVTGSLCIVFGGILCLWRDARESAGKPDLYATLINLCEGRGVHP